MNLWMPMDQSLLVDLQQGSIWDKNRLYLGKPLPTLLAPFGSTSNVTVVYMESGTCFDVSPLIGLQPASCLLLPPTSDLVVSRVVLDSQNRSREIYLKYPPSPLLNLTTNTDVFEIILKFFVRRDQPFHRSGPKAFFDITEFQKLLPLLAVSKKFSQSVRAALENIGMWLFVDGEKHGDKLDNFMREMSGRFGSVVRQLDVLGCDSTINSSTLTHFANTIDLSLMSIGCLTNSDVEATLRLVGPNLKHLSLINCPLLTGAFVTQSIATSCRYGRLENLDLSEMVDLTDDDLGRVLRVCGPNLRLLYISKCANLTDKALHLVGEHCTSKFVQFVGSHLPLITTRGVEVMCSAIYKRFGECNIDSLYLRDCASLSESVIDTVLKYCHQTKGTRIPAQTERERVDSFMRSTCSDYVYLVRGKDRGQPAFYYVFVFPGYRYRFMHFLNGQTIHLEKFSEVVYCSWGEEPTEASCNYVNSQFPHLNLTPKKTQDTSTPDAAMTQDDDEDDDDEDEDDSLSGDSSMDTNSDGDSD
eukprot:c4716_g1_i1.p1 GENE.c4716_g1_i1~~c4716_g1_i1.p1  ORF type:complete len:588 (-),score=116.84 c4716_g1_i1:92-1678(-)